MHMPVRYDLLVRFPASEVLVRESYLYGLLGGASFFVSFPITIFQTTCHAPNFISRRRLQHNFNSQEKKNTLLLKSVDISTVDIGNVSLRIRVYQCPYISSRNETETDELDHVTFRHRYCFGAWWLTRVPSERGRIDQYIVSRWYMLSHCHCVTARRSPVPFYLSKRVLC